MVQWVVQSHGIPLVPHGTVGRDGQVGWLSQPWDGGTIPWDPLVSWYSGTGWTGCPSHGTVVQSHGIPLVPLGRDGQMGWLSQPWDGGTIPRDPLVSWYSGTRWHGCPSHGSVVQSHRIPMSSMVPGVAHMYQMDKDSSTSPMRSYMYHGTHRNPKFPMDIRWQGWT